MNVYDFDQTIYDPDSSYHFYLFCLKTYPGAVIPTLGKSLRSALRYRAGRIGAKELKEHLFSFLSSFSDVDPIVSRFWETHQKGLQSWYLAQKREDDVIVSASPEFLLAPIAKQLGVRLIATRMDSRSGRIEGNNCHDEEKVRRFSEICPLDEIENFYSDSLSDAPLARYARRAYLVRHGKIRPWPDH